MPASFQELLDRIATLRTQGASLADMRSDLMAHGWDRYTVDRALWRLHFRDRKNIYIRQRLRVFGIGVVGLCVFTLLVIGGRYWDAHIYKEPTQEVAQTDADVPASEEADSSDGQDISQADLQNQGPSKLSGAPTTLGASAVAVDFPSSWVLKETSDSDLPDLLSWQIEPQANQATREQLAKKYNFDDEDSGVEEKILADPLAKQLATITIIVLQEPTFQVEKSLEEWKKMLDQTNGNLGYTASGFEKVEINGVQGYVYTSKLTVNNESVSSLEYVFLRPGQRIEISITPNGSRYKTEVEQIISSLSFLNLAN